MTRKERQEKVWNRLWNERFATEPAKRKPIKLITVKRK